MSKQTTLFPSPPPFEIVAEKLNDKDLLIRKSDGYVVASSVCGIINRRWNDWFKTKATQEMIQKFAEKEGILPFLKSDIYDPNSPSKAIVESYRKVHNKYQTIIHRRVAIQFAQSDPSIAWELSNVLDKYIRGDMSLINDVVRRHDDLNGVVTQSVQIIPNGTGDQIESQQTIDDNPLETETRKRKLEALVIEERALKLRDMKIDQKEKEARCYFSIVGLYKQTLGPEIMGRQQIYINDVNKFILEREIKSMLSPSLLQIEGGKAPLSLTSTDSTPFENKEISIALIAQRLKIRLGQHMYSQVGKKMKKLWQQRYKTTQNPPKGKQTIQGKVIEVNTYYEKDADLMENAIREVMEKKAKKK